jgi:hypothetical protein
MFQGAHIMPSDMLHALNTHNMSKICITWTQNMIKYHKVKTKGVSHCGLMETQTFPHAKI